MRTILFTALLGLAGGAAVAVNPSLLFAEDKPAAPSADEIRVLVDMLGSSDFAARERASKKLAELGNAARPALREAARSSESLEQRWRATQILAHIEGRGVRRLGEPGASDQPPGVAPGPSRGRSMRDWAKMIEQMLGGADSDEMKRLLKEYENAMGEFAQERARLEKLVPGWRDMMREGLGRGVAMPGTTKVPGMTLVQKMDGSVELRIENGEDPAAAPRVLTGANLDALVALHPELREHPSFKELLSKRREGDAFPGLLREWSEKLRAGGLDGLQGRLPRIESQVGMNGISVVTTPEGTKITIKERGEDGQVTERTYEGTSIRDIKAKYPEVAQRLEANGRSFKIHIGPPTILRGEGSLRDALERFRRPTTPRSPATPAPAQDGPFGVVIRDVPAALAYQLSLDPGTGVLIQTVRRGSPAAAIGLEVHDILVGVNGQDVTDPMAMAKALRKAGADASMDLTLHVIRRGARMDLVR